MGGVWSYPGGYRGIGGERGRGPGLSGCGSILRSIGGEAGGHEWGARGAAPVGIGVSGYQGTGV